jgi:hypothetical protein
MRPMRLGMLWRIGLLGVAVASGATGAAADPALPGDAPPVERAETPAASAPSLDLRIDPGQLLSRDLPAGPRQIDPEPAERYTGADEHASDRGLSFGLELKPRSPIGSLARQDDVEDPSLTDQLEKVIERPALSLRGRYRF